MSHNTRASCTTACSKTNLYQTLCRSTAKHVEMSHDTLVVDRTNSTSVATIVHYLVYILSIYVTQCRMQVNAIQFNAICGLSK